MIFQRLSAVASLSILFVSAVAIVPKTETKISYRDITDVERTDSTLRVSVRMSNRPNYWCKVPSSSYLVSDDDAATKFKIIGSENFELDQEVWMPASGFYDGVLVFEKVPETVKVVNYIESDPTDLHNNIFGIHLDEEETEVRPEFTTVSDILNAKNTPSNWSGLDYKKYADMAFYDKNGTAHIKGRVYDYSPRSGVTTFSIRTKDDVTSRQKVNVGKINPDGTFAIDISVTYPQYDYFQLGNVTKNLFIIPGDTLSIVTTMATRRDQNFWIVPDYLGFDGQMNDALVINTLTDSLIDKRYNLDLLYAKYAVAESDTMKSETYKSNERLSQLLDSVISDLPVFLGDLPISDFSKDVLSMHAIGKICETMEDIEMNFRFANAPKLQVAEDSTYSYIGGDSLDLNIIMAGRLKHKDLIYNNPILLFNGWILPNRWEYNDLFQPSGMAATGFIFVPNSPSYVRSDDLSAPYEIAGSLLDSIGVGNCFVAQFVRMFHFVDGLKSIISPSYTELERVNKLLPLLIKHNEFGVLNEVLLDEYDNFVKDILIAENELGNHENSSILIDGTEEGEILEKIISPYRGNVLFLDFWGIGCGPCRAGMMNQKPILEKLADKPFKALYIANADEGMEACKKWLRNEDIKGEHIFVSGDNWKQLSGLFNFSAIPFGVLIGKDGNVIKAGYHGLSEDEPLLRKALEEE